MTSAMNLVLILQIKIHLMILNRLELHLPVDKEILLKIRAKDVLHSVFFLTSVLKWMRFLECPHNLNSRSTKTTQQMRDELGNPNFNYELACAEICGRGHFSMKMSVVVEDAEVLRTMEGFSGSMVKTKSGLPEKCTRRVERSGDDQSRNGKRSWINRSDG